MKITLKNGREYPTQYYALVIRHYLEAFRPEESDSASYYAEEYKRKTYYGDSSKTKKAYAGIAISQSIVSNRHLWRDTRLKDAPTFYFSDALKRAFDAAGLTLQKHLKLKDIA